MAFNADPYRTLGLSRGASLDEVKRAYRRLAKANHPDAAGAGALPRFLAIQAAYEQLVGGAVGPAGSRVGPQPRRRPSAADPDRADATWRAYGAGSRGPRPGAGPRTSGDGSRPTGTTGARRATGGRGTPGAGPDTDAARPDGGVKGDSDTGTGDGTIGGDAKPRSTRGKATLGSTSYDDAGPRDPDWGGASWYGTTSGTYWTINPKEYADPRKHGPEYQARARRAAEARAAASEGREPGAAPSGAPTHTTSSWWDSTSGPAATPAGSGAGTDPAEDGPGAAQGPGPGTATDGAAEPRRVPDARATAYEAAPDPASAAVDLGRALTDPRSGGLRGRVVRAFLGWLPIALGLGWLVGELTGCGRFAATCDPSVTPLAAVGQVIVLAALLLLPEVAAMTAGAALVLLVAAVAASLVLSATGAAADEGSRRVALMALLVVAWLTGFAIAAVRRIRSGPRSAGPVS